MTAAEELVCGASHELLESQEPLSSSVEQLRVFALKISMSKRHK
jgi:hypothetical protein